LNKKEKGFDHNKQKYSTKSIAVDWGNNKFASSLQMRAFIWC